MTVEAIMCIRVREERGSAVRGVRSSESPSRKIIESSHELIKLIIIHIVYRGVKIKNSFNDHC